MKKFKLELYFYKDTKQKRNLSDKPNLDLYSKKTILKSISSTNINNARTLLEKQYDNLAYIHILNIENLNY